MLFENVMNGRIGPHGAIRNSYHLLIYMIDDFVAVLIVSSFISSCYVISFLCDRVMVSLYYICLIFVYVGVLIGIGSQV